MSTILNIHARFRRSCTLEEQLSKNTVRAYRICMEVFLKRTGITEFREIDLAVLREFFYEGREVYQWSYSSFVNHRQYLKKFFDWCIAEGYMDQNLVSNIKKPKRPKSLPRRLTFEEGQRILSAALSYRWRYEFENARNYAIMAVFLYTGLRCEELLNLRWIDVNLDEKNLLVRQSKGNKDRNVPIHSKLIYPVKQYIRAFKRLKKRSEYFFTGVQSNSRLNYKDVATICKKVSASVNIKFTPHCLRHTFGSVAIEQGLGIVQLRDIMGHSDIQSTMIYLSMSSQSLREGINKLDLF